MARREFESMSEGQEVTVYLRSNRPLAAAVIKVMGAAVLLAAVGYAQQQPQWQSREEYDLFTSCQGQTDGAKRLDCIKQWKDKFPTSQFKQAGLTINI